MSTCLSPCLSTNPKPHNKYLSLLTLLYFVLFWALSKLELRIVVVKFVAVGHVCCDIVWLTLRWNLYYFWTSATSNSGNCVKFVKISWRQKYFLKKQCVVRMMSCKAGGNTSMNGGGGGGAKRGSKRKFLGAKFFF